MARRSLPAIVVAVLVVGACGGGAVSPPPSPDASASPAATAATATPRPSPAERVVLLAGTPMTRCQGGLAWTLCGTLTVPEDRSNPSGRTIDLKVVVVPSSSTNPEPDPLFALAGGPGGAATTSFTWLPGTFSAIRASRDIVFVDQRGTGGSNQLVIPTPPDWGDITQAERDAKMAAWAADALAALDADPRQYTTSVAMDDLDDVREALGYERINLYGPSYGATAVQYYLRQYPDRVRSAVLDGGTLVDVPIFERIAASSQGALDLVLDRCEADATCHAAFPDVRAEAAAVFARLAEGPISVPMPSGDPEVLDAASWSNAIHDGLLDATLAAYIPAAVHLLATEDWPALAALIASLSNAGQGGGPDLVMSRVIRCSEAWARFDPAEVRRTGAESYQLAVQEANATSWAVQCAAVPRGVVPADDAEPVRTDRPVLVILGDGDPQNPPANVADAATEMPNSRTIVVPGLGHTVGHLGCMPNVIASFVDAGSADGLDTSCVARMTPPPFVIP